MVNVLCNIAYIPDIYGTKILVQMKHGIFIIYYGIFESNALGTFVYVIFFLGFHFEAISSIQALVKHFIQNIATCWPHLIFFLEKNACLVLFDSCTNVN